jgi:predicted O-methyltransferase YrrM
MNHYYQTIQGWFNYESLYDTAIKLCGPTGHFVEVGSWRGKSSCYLGVTIRNSGKNIRVDCVDTWRGSLAEEVHQTDPAVLNDTLYQEFLSNIEPLKDILHPVRATSVEASKLYQNASLDFILIDGSHEYEDVIDDINCWLPKLKPGCLIAGDDYEWPGVKRAVHELLPDFDHIPVLGLWVYRKPE